MEKKIHIGEMIRAAMKNEGRSTQWLAEQLHCNRSNIYKIYKRTSINTELLQHIERILQVDLFVYYSKKRNIKR